jgi:KDO2-lipid IV(A) lauroyltransferase
VATVIPVTQTPKEFPDYDITDRYAQLLEEQIRQCPELWLWTHNRWKRTRQEWENRKERTAKA